MSKKIQEQFGQAMMTQVAIFAKTDIKSVAALAANEYSHIADADLRNALAQTHYGTRWLYKLGLALLVDGDESSAHVRTQIIDYGSVCESLLKDSVGHGIRGGHFTGIAHTTSQATRGGNSLNWNNIDKTLKTRDYWWLIEVAQQERIVDAALAQELHRVRKMRNTVHLTYLAASNLRYVRSLAKRSLTTLSETIVATKAWKATHP
jgi:hypothetical protein